MKTVKYKGKTYLYDEANGKLLEVGADGKETGTVITDFKKEEIEAGEPKTYGEEVVTKLRQESAQYRTENKKFRDAMGDMTPEEIKALRDRADDLKRKEEEAEEAKAKAEGRYTEILDKKLKAFETEKVQLTAERDAAVAELRNYRIGTELMNAAQRPDAINPAQVAQLLRGSISLDKDGQLVVLDEDGKTPRLSKKDAKPMVGSEGIKAFVDEFYEMSPHFIRGHAGGAGSGGGSGGGGGGAKNPWLKTEFNLTEQSRITRENPELAARLKAAAGV